MSRILSKIRACNVRHTSSQNFLTENTPTHYSMNECNVDVVSDTEYYLAYKHY